MSKQFNDKRRKFIQVGLICGIDLLIRRNILADELTDLINSNVSNEIIAIRLWPSSIYTRLTLEAENSIKAKCQVFDKPLSLVVDIKDVQLNAILNGLDRKVLSEDPVIRDIKVSQIDPQTVRVEIFLKQHIQVQTQAINPVNLGAVNYKYRYVIDMYPHGNSDDTELNDDLLAFLELNSDGSQTDQTNSKTQVSDSLSSIVATPKIQLTKSPELKDISPRKILVMLDPGHGGEDPGAIGPTGLKEKDVVLDIGKKIQESINQMPNMRALLTRNQDIFIPLATRVAIARRAKADLFISIHADAFTTPQARGSSVFILSDKGASSSFARWLAKTQNQADLIGGMSFNTRDKSVSRVLLDMTQTWTINTSGKLGKILLGQMSGINQLHNKNVERASFAVLKAPDIPSALVETAFISNPFEENLLRQNEFRQKVADTLAKGINNFAKTIRIS